MERNAGIRESTHRMKLQEQKEELEGKTYSKEEKKNPSELPGILNFAKI